MKTTILWLLEFLLFSSPLGAMEATTPTTERQACVVCLLNEETLNQALTFDKNNPAIPIHLTRYQSEPKSHAGHFCHLHCLKKCIHSHSLICPTCGAVTPIVNSNALLNELDCSGSIYCIGPLLYFFAQEPQLNTNAPSLETTRAIYICNEKYAPCACFKMSAPFYRLFGQHKRHEHEKQD